MTSSALAVVRSRLPMPAGIPEIDARKWRVLVETTFPTARTPEAVVMALDYCRARGLDVFKKPVHIVPMWNSSLGREVETVWPGINEVQITAARTREWAGMDEPKWGAPATRLFKGRKKSKNGWETVEVSVTFPDWCAVTVYRIVGGERCAFTEPVFWLEAYSRAGGGELPTEMWIKRPRGQLQKVAKAASLRAAFPEEGEYTAEEMAGKEIEADDSETVPATVPSPAEKAPEVEWLNRILDAQTIDELGQVSQAIHKANLAADVLAQLRAAFIRRKIELTPTTQHDPETGEIQEPEPQGSPPASADPEPAEDTAHPAEASPAPSQPIPDTPERARERGFAAFHAGASRRAIPGEYRGTPLQLEWQDGFDAARDEAKAP